MNSPIKNSTYPSTSGRFRARFFSDVAMFLRLGYHFWRGFHFLRNTERAMTIFGSARFPKDHPCCKQARLIAQHFASQGFSIVTGGGPSIMEAANQGAYESTSKSSYRSIGINIELPKEQHINPYVTLNLKERYFFVRKVLLSRYSEAYIIFPGGFGTLDEFFEVITLIQTKKMPPRPVILMGRDYWQGLMAWIQNTMVQQETIDAHDLHLLHWVDTAEEAIEILERALLKS